MGQKVSHPQFFNSIAVFDAYSKKRLFEKQNKDKLFVKLFKYLTKNLSISEPRS